MNINVTATKVTIDKGNVVNKGEYNIRDCNFTLSEEYNGLVCKALFTIEKTNKTYEQSIVNNKCTIPYEVTVEKGAITLGVIGYEIEDDELIKRYSPLPYHFTIEDGSYIEDIENQSTPTPSELEQLEARVSQVEIDAEQVEINTQNISDLQENKADKSELEDFITKDVNDLTYYTLTTQTGSQIELTLNSTNFKMTATLKDKNGIVVNTSNEIDLPLESVVVNASYDSATKELVLTLQNGNTVRISIADLVSGLVSFTDYATSSKGGVIKADTYYGIGIYDDGKIYALPRTYQQYSSMAVRGFISKETLENVITGKELVNETQLDESQATQDDLIEALQTENARIKSTLPTTTGTGENITLSKTAELEFIQPPLPRGNSEQVQYSGKQLFNKDTTVVGNYNCTYTFNDGIYTITSIDTQNNFSFTLRLDLSTGSYTLNSTKATSDSTMLYNSQNEMLVNLSNNHNYYNFSIAENSTSIRFNFLATSQPVTLDLNSLQIVSGTYTSSTMPAYEPYVGGTASPNPSYPQEITNVTGDVEVLVQNKNILPFNNQDFTLNGVRYYVQNGSLYMNGTSLGETSTTNTNFKNNFSFILKAGTYYIKRSSNSVPFSLNKKSDNSTVRNTQGSFTITEDTEVYLGFYIYNKTFENTLIDIQLEPGSTASTYTPHQEQTYTFPLGTQRMYLGDYLADDGIHHVRGVMTFDGSNDESWDIQSNAYFRSGSIQDIATSTSNSKCTIATITTLSSLSSSDVNKYAVGGTRLWFRCPQFETLANWKAYLAENPITVEYELATEEITPYTTEQQQAYDEIKQAISYEEQTNISGSSDESNPLFSVEAYQSIKLVLAG